MAIRLAHKSAMQTRISISFVIVSTLCLCADMRVVSGGVQEKPDGVNIDVDLGRGGLINNEDGSPVLNPDDFRPYIERFNADDQELYTNTFPNARAWEFLAANMPLFECQDKDLELTYYFRWWVYRKHLVKTPDGWVVTEFMPRVSWAGRHNTVNLTACMHLNEGRWLRDPTYLDDYTRFWFRKGGARHSYTTWLAHAIWGRAAVTGDEKLPVDILDDLIEYHSIWEQGKAFRGMGGRPNGLFYTSDDRDGGEVSIGGHGFRPLINGAMYGDRMAIAEIADRAGRAGVATEFRAKAESLKALVQSRLWDKERQFFMILREDEKSLSDVRELYGLSPWMFHLPDPGYEAGWRELDDPKGFKAPFGPTFPEQRHPRFGIWYRGHECQWNGPSWPLATSITLMALANLLNDYEQTAVDRQLFFDTLLTYARSHRRVCEDGRILPWIDENLNPYTGDWIARTMLLEHAADPKLDPSKKPIPERGKDYNHSTFCDLVISGLVGIRPQHDDMLVVNPLLPQKAWDWFCLDRALYRGHEVTVIWDRAGTKYGRGKGLQVLVDGWVAARAEGLGRLVVPIRSKQ